MVTAPPPKPPPKTKRETWADWLPDVEPTLTIDDVIARLKARGVDDVTVENIRFWQKERVLPAPIRRQVGTGKGGIRALYPPQAVDAIAEIRPLQYADVPLRQINAQLARRFGIDKGPISHPLTAHIGGPEFATVTVREQDTALLEAIQNAATRQEQRSGAPIRKVEVIFTDTDGRKYFHLFPLHTE